MLGLWLQLDVPGFRLVRARKGHGHTPVAGGALTGNGLGLILQGLGAFSQTPVRPQHATREREAKQAAGEEEHPHAYVALRSLDELVEPRNLVRSFQRIYSAHGLRVIKVHHRR
jgi:hypothetical protein